MIMADMRGKWRAGLAGLFGFAALAFSVSGAAQVTSVDPNKAIDGDLKTASAPASAPAPSPSIAVDPAPATTAAAPVATASQAAASPAQATKAGTTYKQDDLIGAAEGVFGKGAQGLAQMIQDLLKKQGEPNAYIVGREGGGAVVVGLRYGSGTLHHKIEGQKPVYWTGPSVGLDVGANAANTFVLVYNLYNTEDLYKRFGAGEGQAYLVGGFHVSYLRRGDVVLIPVRMGAGLRLGVNAGYMKFSKKQRWLPF
ncbi:MAG: DUF1134 domain-containing protein [Novosphingobium sp.]|uniref:DUF1134 domain-containing protein n=1 Tax=Novosphingobium sp. TaxID=1874826 RepID=UPI00391AFA66